MAKSIFITRSLVWAIILTFLSVSINAVEVLNLSTGRISTKDSVAAPKIDINSTSDSHTITFKLTEVGIAEDVEMPGRKFITIPGFTQTTEAGTPSLPIKGERFHVPVDKKLQISMVSALVKGTYAVTISENGINTGNATFIKY